MTYLLRRNQLRVASVTCFALLQTACGDSPGTGTGGELGQGTFKYACALNGDPVCSETEAIDARVRERQLASEGGVPDAVAVGAPFGIEYGGTEREEGDVLFVDVSPASPEDESVRGEFTIEQPAEAAFLARNSDGEVIDFVLVTAFEATQLVLWADEEEVASVELALGESIELTVVPASEDGQFLGGALSYTWSVEDSDVARIGRVDSAADEQRVDNSGDLLLKGLTLGQTTLRVTAGGLGLDVSVEVIP
jgi:hypothetical protein